MAEYTGMTLTKKGRALQAKAQTGVKLEFTKVMVGDGLLAGGVSIDTLTQLIAPKMTLAIQDMAVIGDGTSRIRVVLHNKDIETGVFIREVGVYANDPQEGEILYSITNSGDQSEWLPPKGSSRVVELILDLITVVGTASNVTAIINDTLLFATRQDLKEHINDKNNPHHVTAVQAGAAPTIHLHTISQITDFPAALPANGGNAATVGGVRITIGVAAPANPAVDKEIWIDTANNLAKIYKTSGWQALGAIYL